MQKIETKVDEMTLHWADEQEAIKTNKPLVFLLNIIKFMPRWFSYIIVFPVSFFFFIFSKRARNEAKYYQNVLREYTNGEVPKRISAYKQVFSFAMCIVEKLDGWLGRFDYDKLIKHDDDLPVILKQLDEGKGAFIIGSHLGNMELLRSISSLNSSGVKRHVDVTAIMEMNSTEQFNNILKTVDPNVQMNLIDAKNIGPETICLIEDKINEGGMVFIAADRTSASARTRVLTHKFLGKEAEFPYGVFMMASLLKVPTYYIFGMRDKTITLLPKQHIYVEKSNVDFNCARNERESRINDLCLEYISKLEKYVKMYPYQWYNFHNFWLLQNK